MTVVFSWTHKAVAVLHSLCGLYQLDYSLTKARPGIWTIRKNRFLEILDYIQVSLWVVSYISVSPRCGFAVQHTAGVSVPDLTQQTYLSFKVLLTQWHI